GESKAARADRAALRMLVEEKRPAEAIVGKTVEIMRSIAMQSHGRVGAEYSSAVLTSGKKPGSVDFHPEVASDVLGHIAQVDFEIGAFYGTVSVVGKKSTGPKLRRNEPCWCGSGKKYKRCHGA